MLVAARYSDEGSILAETAVCDRLLAAGVMPWDHFPVLPDDQPALGSACRDNEATLLQ